MGEIAEMMLDGTMCAGCGEWLHDGDDGDGFPGYCASCAPDYEEKPVRRRKPENNTIIPCPDCGKRVRGQIGLRQHTEAKHPKEAA